MSKGKKKITLRDITSKAPEEHEQEAILNELLTGSDRACALIAASFLDRALMSLLATQMHGVHIDEHTSIFYGQNAILGTFSNKIRICYVLSLISKEQAQYLNKMREIRNHFAHSMNVVSFSDSLVADACETLWSDADTIPAKLHHLPTARMKFMARWSKFSKDLPHRYIELLNASPHLPTQVKQMVENFVLSKDADSSNS